MPSSETADAAGPAVVHRKRPGFGIEIDPAKAEKQTPVKFG